jgi:acyl-CoA thioesterase FadM
MSRVKLKFPDENPLFIAMIPVRIGDINYGGHVGNDSILSIVHEARMQMLRASGYDEMNAGGSSLIMADVMIAYKGESFYGDILTVKIFTEEVKDYSFDLLYLLSTSRKGIQVEIAHAKTGMVCFDYEIRKVAPITAELKSFLKSNV